MIGDILDYLLHWNSDYKDVYRMRTSEISLFFSNIFKAEFAYFP